MRPRPGIFFSLEEVSHPDPRIQESKPSIIDKYIFPIKVVIFQLKLLSSLQMFDVISERLLIDEFKLDSLKVIQIIQGMIT
jgi:hypothetical protein